MRDDQLSGTQRDDVELDEIDAGRERGAKGGKGVLRRERGRPSMPDHERPTVTPLERDQGADGRVGR